MIRIIAYYSKVGNSDVPYPVALGEKNAYFMLGANYTWSKKRPILVVVLFHVSVFPPNTDWEDAYMLFYGHKGDEALAELWKEISQSENNKKTALVDI